MEYLHHRQELKDKDTEIDKIRFHEMKTSKSMMLFLYIKLLLFIVSLKYTFEVITISRYNCTQNKKQQQIRFFSI